MSLTTLFSKISQEKESILDERIFQNEKKILELVLLNCCDLVFSKCQRF